VEYIAGLSMEDYIQAGAVLPRTVTLMRAKVELHPASMAEQFWKLGLPVEAKDGRVLFAGEREEYKVCQEGWELTVKQCKILVHMGRKLAVFWIGLVCRWEKEDGAVKEF
jgi:hypothetical protein